MQELRDKLEAAGFDVQESNSMPDDDYVVWHVASEGQEGYVRSDDADAVELIVNPPVYDPPDAPVSE